MNMMQLIQALRGNGNPEGMLRQLAGQNPAIAQALQLVEGKTPQQVSQIAANMARERGVDINVLTQQIRQALGL